MLKKDLKKGFLRVKQLADQGLGRAEKTEVLSSDLQNAEKKVDTLKTIISNTLKKISSSLLAANIADHEKRLKKYPSVSLASSLMENSQIAGDGMLSKVFEQSSRGQQDIGEALSQYELLVETSILAYLQQLYDVDIPAIKRTKAQLTKLTLDMDATKSRHQSAQKQLSDHPTANHNSKSETLKDDLEEAENRVTFCKDQYATEMLTFISKESEICEKIILLMEAQADYHRTCLKKLDDLLPEMRSCLGQHSLRPLYGCPLDEHLQANGREIAFVIEACVSILYHEALEEEGLFRIAGGASKVKKLKAAFNVGTIVDMEEYFSDLHAVAGSLKQYLRELPEPLLTFDLFDEFMQCMTVKDHDTRMRNLWSTVKKLPTSNFVNVRYLIKFLAKLAEKSDINKMTPSNIAIVFAPNLLWAKDRNDDGMDVAMSSVRNVVIENLVTHHDYFFPGDDALLDLQVSQTVHKRNLSSAGSISDLSSSVSLSSLTTGSIEALNDLETSTTSVNSENKKTRGTNRFSNALSSLSTDKLFGQVNNKLNIKKSKDKTVSASERHDDEKKKKRKTKSLSSILGLKSHSSDSVEQKDPFDEKSDENVQKTIFEESVDDTHAQGVVFKPRYQPQLELCRDGWFTGAQDCPLADGEGDSPLMIEPPTRSFPLTNPIPPTRLHGEKYDTAFVLASLKGDGLKYMNETQTVLDNSYRGNLISSQTSKLTALPKTGLEDAHIIDLDDLCTSGKSGSMASQTTESSGSLKKQSSPASSVQRSVSDTMDRPLAKKPDSECSPSRVGTSPQASLSSLESISVETSKSVSSPNTRRAKKAAPAPPKSPASRPELQRKPSGPPPARPSGPPPPTPATAKLPETEASLIDLDEVVVPPISSMDQNPADSMPAAGDLLTGLGNMSINMSNTAEPMQSSPADAHLANQIEPLSITPSTVQPDAKSPGSTKGHNRAASADFRPKIKPPPIPQRTHSVKTSTAPLIVSSSTYQDDTSSPSPSPKSGNDQEQIEKLLRKNSGSASTPL